MENLEVRESDIIEAEYSEVQTGADALCEVTAQIRSITASLLWHFIELGKRFEKAKALVKHGKWGEWCEQCTGYKQRMAENYITLYHEYGDDQISLFADFTNSQSIANLGVTKLLELTALPADERERFVQENGVDESTTVKELRAMIAEQKKQMSDAAEKAEEKEARLCGEIGRLQKQAEASESEINRLIEELESTKEQSAPDARSDDEVQKMIADAEAKAREAAEKTIGDLKADLEKKQREIEKKQKQLDKLKQNDAAAENEQLKETVSAAERKNKELESEIDRLRKEASLGSDKSLAKLDLCFKSAQDEIHRLAAALEECRETEKYEQLKTAVKTTLAGMIEEI